MPKILPKMSKRVLNKCWGNSFEKLFCPVFHGGSSLRNVFKNRKFSKFQKCPKSFPKCPNVFWTSVGVILSKNYFAQCSMEGRVFEIFSKNQKSFKFSRMPKIVPKSVQTCFEQVLGTFFEKIILPSVPWRVESSKCFQKSKIFKIPKMPKIVPKSVQTCFQQVLG